MGPSQYAVIGDTVKSGISNMIDRKSNKSQLATQREGLEAQSDYVDSQSDLMKDQYGDTLQPYTETGANSTRYLGDLDTDVSSLDPLQTREDYTFEMGDFTADPGYDFRLSQGTDAIDQGAAADGSLFSGGAAKELMEYGQNLGSDEYQNVYDREFNEFQDANTQYQDSRDYNTAIDTNNMDRDVSNQQFLSSQGSTAATNEANADLGINQDQTEFGVGNIGALYGNTAAKTANKYGFARDQNEIAGDGFSNFMGSFSGGFGG